jgi:hypothetical protein
MSTEHKRASQRGQTLIVFALAFTLFLFALTCLVADGSFLFRWSGRVQAAAQLAAQSGADAVDPRFLYGGSQCTQGHSGCSTAIVDISAQDRTGSLYAFQRACIQAGDQSASVPRHPPNDLSPKTANDAQLPEGTQCFSDGCRVVSLITRMVPLPIAVPGFPASVPVRGVSLAAPVIGTNQPQATCSGGTWVPAAPPA